MLTTQRRPIGRTELQVTELSFGGAPIGNFLAPSTDDQARELVDHAWDLGIRYFDTAPAYGNGLSEYRLGHALRERSRDDYIISTKAGYVLTPAAPGSFDAGPWKEPPPFATSFDYTYDGVMRSFESSLARLSTDHVDILFMHDIDRYTHGDAQQRMFDTAIAGGFRALMTLREQGAVTAIGVGVNESDVCAAVIRQTDSDCVLLAGRYTLLEQEPLDALFPLCEERDVSVVLGGVFNSGVLATGPVPGAKFNYGPAPQDVLDRAARLQQCCHRFGVPLPAAALQFAAAHPVVASVCAGSRNQAQQAASRDWWNLDIPGELWSAMREEGLVRRDAPTP